MTKPAPAAASRRRSTSVPGLEIVRQRDGAEIMAERRADPRRDRQHRGDAGHDRDIELPPGGVAALDLLAHRGRHGEHAGIAAGHHRDPRALRGERSAAAARAPSSRLSEAWRVWPAAPARGRDRGRSRRARRRAASAAPASGVSGCGSPGPRPTTASEPLMRPASAGLPARHQDDREVGATSSRLSASGMMTHPPWCRARHRWRAASRPVRTSARRTFSRWRPSFITTAASASSKAALQLASGKRGGQHDEHVVALGDRRAGARPAARHRGDAGHDLGPEVRRKAHMQMHVGAVEERIALAQHRDRAAAIEMARHGGGGVVVEVADGVAVRGCTASAFRSSPDRAAAAPRRRDADAARRCGAHCWRCPPWRNARPRRPRRARARP